LRAGAGVFYNRVLLRTVDDFTLGREVVEFDTNDLPSAERRAFLAANIRFPETLAADSTHSQIVDLEDPALLPEGWRDLATPAVCGKPQIQEVSVRDFSIADASVREEHRGTYLAFQKRVDLPILVEKDRPLLNIYSVMEVNPANGPRVNAAGGRAFAEFILAPDTQAVIKTFGVDKYGQPLFVPIAGKKDEDL
jgi:hypothetical protein